MSRLFHALCGGRLYLSAPLTSAKQKTGCDQPVFFIIFIPYWAAFFLSRIRFLIPVNSRSMTDLSRSVDKVAVW